MPKVLQLLKKNFEKIGIQNSDLYEKEKNCKNVWNSSTADVLVVDETMEDCRWSGFLYVACRQISGHAEAYYY